MEDHGGLSKHAGASCVGEMKRNRNCAGQACSDRVNEYTRWRVGEKRERGKDFQETSNVCKNQGGSLHPSRPLKRSGCG